ncbi:MAG TPA: Crp/Fnr family transcriptional regulator [Mucilaginibacter sp.]|nr:Crp/Fnr family transcriptional regulator [Mucilaginibacter sp.]
MNQACDLKRCFLCAHSLPEWHDAICSHRKNLEFRKGQAVFNEGDEVKGIYFVYSGTIKVHKKWGADKELIIRFASNGSILGHRGLTNDKIYSVSATAIEPAIVCYVDLDFFKWSLKVNHTLSYSLMMFFAEELGEAEQKMHDLALMPVKECLKEALIKLEKQFGRDDDGYINLRLPRQDLAQFTGTTYETVFRTLNEMRDEGSIELEKKRIKLVSTLAVPFEI